jgi:hypothetical protein
MYGISSLLIIVGFRPTCLPSPYVRALLYRISQKIRFGQSIVPSFFILQDNKYFDLSVYFAIDSISRVGI